MRKAFSVANIQKIPQSSNDFTLFCLKSMVEGKEEKHFFVMMVDICQ